MFKEGVKPAWEDAFNEKGGKWSMLIPRNTNKSDSSWLYSV
jgi:translation initiation factor 4E